MDIQNGRRQDIKKVLVIAPTPFFADRGCHVHIAEQVWALQKLGIDCLVVTYGIGRDVTGIKTVRTPRFPWYNKLGPGPSWDKFYIDAFLLWKAFWAAKKYKPNIIHGHLHEGALIGWVLKVLLRIPLVFDCQGSLTGELIAHNFPLVRLAWLRTIWHRMEMWIDHRADIILAQSSNMKDELLYEFQIPKEKIVMAYDGVNTTVFKPFKKDETLLASLNIPRNSPIIVFLGVLTPYQGIDDLLAAMPAVLSKIPSTILIIMGYPNVQKYKEMAEQLGISHAVRFTGKVLYENAPTYLALGDVAVSAKRSQTEANGKIYNYMACGLPTIAFDTVVNRDILGNLGVYVHNIGDVRGLESAIISTLSDTKKRDELSAQIRQRAVDKYSWDNVARRILSAYHTII